MAKRPRIVALVGTPLPVSWRTSTWQVAPMLAKIAPSDYEATARAFETHHRRAGAVSGNWMEEWKTWCRAELVRRFNAPRVEALFGD